MYIQSKSKGLTYTFTEVVAYADTYSEKGSLFEGKPCLTPEELKQSGGSFDRIVLATVGYKDEMTRLLRSLGFKPERIV